MSKTTVWYYARNGRQIGPLTTTQLRAAATNGDLRPVDLIWREGLASWISASEATGLFPPDTSSHNSIDPKLPPSALKLAASYPQSFNEVGESCSISSSLLAAQLPMTQYTVIGVEQSSGLDKMLAIEASTPENAKIKAELKGIIVSSVNPMHNKNINKPPAMTTTQRDMQQDAQHIPNALPTTKAIGWQITTWILLVIEGIIALMFIKIWQQHGYNISIPIPVDRSSLGTLTAKLILIPVIAFPVLISSSQVLKRTNGIHGRALHKAAIVMASLFAFVILVLT